MKKFLVLVLLCFLVGCQKGEAPEGDLSKSGRLGEVISPGVCRNINQKNLLAYIANHTDVYSRDMAREILAHSKIGQWTHVEPVLPSVPGANVNPNTAKVFDWSISVPRGTSKITVVARFSCSPLTGRVEKIYTSNPQVVVVKTTIGIRQHANHKPNNSLLIPGKGVYYVMSQDTMLVSGKTIPRKAVIYSRSASSSQGLVSQSAFQKEFALENGKVTFPADFSTEALVLDASGTIDLTDIMASQSTQCGSSFPPSMPCEKCQDEAEAVRTAHKRWYDACTAWADAKEDIRKENNKGRSNLLLATSSAVASIWTCTGSVAAPIAAPACIGTFGSTVFHGSEVRVNYQNKIQYEQREKSAWSIKDAREKEELKPANKAYNTCNKLHAGIGKCEP